MCKPHGIIKASQWGHGQLKNPVVGYLHAAVRVARAASLVALNLKTSSLNIFVLSVIGRNAEWSKDMRTKLRDLKYPLTFNTYLIVLII